MAKLPFGQRTQLAVASAWSPNPAKPPLDADLPFGDLRDNVLHTSHVAIRCQDHVVPFFSRNLSFEAPPRR